MATTHATPSPDQQARNGLQPHPVQPTDDRAVLWRGAAVIGLLAIALIHVLDAPGKFHETPYLGWGYVVLIAACLVVGGMLMERGDRRAWMAAVVISVIAFVAYALSRTTGLPQASDDVGNWFEPLGVATLFAEVMVTLIAVRALAASARR